MEQSELWKLAAFLPSVASFVDNEGMQLKMHINI